MLSDSVGTVAGARTGNINSYNIYVESAGAGVKAGGRTGMTSTCYRSILFLLLSILCTSLAKQVLPKEIDGAAINLHCNSIRS